jgi:FMN phosphatase YigB (HAD superfamily)
MSRTLRRAQHLAWILNAGLVYRRCRVRSTKQRGYRKAVAGAAVVSIDVFDTALLRCVPEPRDVFEVVGVRLRAASALILEPAAFRDLRAAGEREARELAARAGREEVTLEEIYAVVGRSEPALDLDRAMAEEVAVERAVCVANRDFKQLYDALQLDGRRVAFVSDTYLPEAFVAELLHGCGYTGKHDVVVSNAACATKETGTLWSLVARRLGVAPDRIVHVGDRLGADVKTAHRAGVRAYWYAGRERGPRNGDAIADKVLDGLTDIAALDERGTAEERMLRRVAYGVVGPIFLGFAQWLVERVGSGPADLVLFCARDGYFVHQAYARLARHVPLPPARYFEVSRRALVFPAITGLDARALDFLCANIVPIAASEYFRRIGIDVGAYPAELAAAGLRPESRIYDLDSRRRLRELFLSLADVVLERARLERDVMLAYVRQSGAFDAQDLVFVDMGWGGTLQQAVAGVLAGAGKTPRMRAYYLSTDERILTLDATAGPASAWFANAGQPAWMREAIAPGYWFLETAFTAQHGTVLGYRQDGSGSVCVEHHAYDPQSPAARTARAVHAASGDLLDRWIQIFGGVGPAVPMRSAFARFQRFVERPSLHEARFFGDMVHIGGLGTTTETRPIAAPPSFGEALRHPRAFQTAYRESLWQQAFVQRVVGSNTVARALLAVRDRLRPHRDQNSARNLLKPWRWLAGSIGG